MKFKITNITVKPIRRNKAGKDLRTMTERVGHPVKMRGADDRDLPPLYQGRMLLVDQLTSGMMSLQRGGFIRIEEIENIAAALKEHAVQGSVHAAAKRQASAAARDSNRKARAVEMGKDTHKQKGGSEHEEAVNPGGDPNFLAPAESDSTRLKKKVSNGTAAVGTGN